MRKFVLSNVLTLVATGALIYAVAKTQDQDFAFLAIVNFIVFELVLVSCRQRRHIRIWYAYVGGLVLGGILFTCFRESYLPFDRPPIALKWIGTGGALGVLFGFWKQETTPATNSSF